MQLVNDHLVFSATDLSHFLECPHRTLLDRAVAFGAPKPPRYDDPALEVLRERGLQHERAYLEARAAEGLRMVEIAAPDPSLADAERWKRRREATVAAMRGGADVVYQGSLFDGTWRGHPDFLVRVDEPSALGDWSYDVVDTKLAREAKGGALLQVLLYADLVEAVQGSLPRRVHLALGGPGARTEMFPVRRYAATFRSARDRMLALLEAAPSALPVAPEPVPHCQVCDWRGRCEREREEVDHLSLVAGISRGQRDALRRRGVETMAALAHLPLPVVPPLEGVGAPTLERIREQARIQVEGREADEPRYELLLPVTEEQGLASLPAPSPGDIFFDLESDPYALAEGIEYLFGVCDAEGGYTGTWALTRAEEKRAFEGFIDGLMARLEEHPDLHVYHFAPYEPAALKRLMGRHATREDQVDHLLRRGVFVDLYRVVRNGLRASVESYSIKKLEPFYGYERAVDLRDASHALAHFEAWLELDGYEADGDALRQRIEGYNEDDCLSTLRLRDWLEGLRGEAEAATGSALPRPTPKDGQAKEAVGERREEVARRYDALLEGVPDDPAERSEEEKARWLLAQLLEFHRRENKATWWEFYRCKALSEDEAVEDAAALGGLVYEGVVGTVRRSEIHRYRFPPQDHGLRASLACVDPATEKSPGTIVDLDDAAGTLDLRRGKRNEAPHPRSIFPFDFVKDGTLSESLLRVADAVLDHGLGPGNPFRAAADLLLRIPPRAGQPTGAPMVADGEDAQAVARRTVMRLDATVLPIQGPPGSGKTHTGAHMIVEALEAGLRVGVTATSHKVIGHLLEKTCEVANEEGVVIAGVQKVTEEDQSCGRSEVRSVDYDELRRALDDGSARLAAGTAWLWSRQDMIGAVDVLFIDEAGQFSLANTLAVAPAATSLVLLGDPRQLEQPQQGVHPPGSDASALDHLLDGAATVPGDRGIFLADTWRLHPELCRFTSEVFYDGRLRSLGGLERQVVSGDGPLRGSGLRFLPVEHAGNRSEAPEEVEVIRALVGRMLASGCRWSEQKGAERELAVQDLTLGDILIVAPYNAQVSALEKALPGARVGTVDRFQGQEAAVVLYSMTTSSADEAPRGMEFLYSPNRLNVATSRARCLAVLVGNPAVFTPPFRTPRQMMLANGFCRFREMAEVVGGP